MSLSQGEMAFVRDLVYKRAAIVLDESKEYLISTRLEQLVRSGGYDSVGDLVTQARQGMQDTGTKLVEAFATHETSFFRDIYPFEALRREILPRLIAERKNTRVLTIWSAACSSGQEPYSIAMLAHEHFPELLKWPVHILATDLSNQVVASARAGCFRQIDVNRGLPADLLVKYFDREGIEWCIKPAIRQVVDFRVLNLLDSWGTQIKPDIVFLRNVLIYFDVETKKRILRKVRQVLPPDGVLFLGSAETTLNLDDHWERVPFSRSAYYRVRQL